MASQGDGTYLAPVFQGKTLRAYRNRVRLLGGGKLTLRLLGERLGVSAQAVHNWEAGNNEPEAHMLPLIAKEVGCAVGDLFVRMLSPPPPLILQEPPQNQGFLRELLEALILELAPHHSEEQARELAARIAAEAGIPPDQATGASSGGEALIRVRTILRSRKT